MEDFETWCGTQGKPWPSTNFEVDVIQYSETPEGEKHVLDTLIGLIEGGVKFAMIEIASKGIPFRPRKELEPIYDDWVETMESVNAASPVGMNKGIMTGSDYFTWMASESEFV